MWNSYRARCIFWMADRKVGALQMTCGPGMGHMIHRVSGLGPRASGSGRGHRVWAEPRQQLHHLLLPCPPCKKASSAPTPASPLRHRAELPAGSGAHLDQEGVVVPADHVAGAHGAVEADPRAAGGAVGGDAAGVRLEAPLCMCQGGKEESRWMKAGQAGRWA